ncbi:alpha-2-macroglobulin family protein [Oricola sp.]|uniref:alpha-2-macroglobulin family protein n=1 Tax=Oricola sp. TaxID=1979950 RepID=UPI0025D86133|nr:alpha-2-macroglobulin family protein [Oricola sp.]MCI5075231.1 alpha-2-macroglobulin family protein [Oricola sp.]
MIKRALFLALSALVSSLLAVNLAAAQQDGRRAIVSQDGDYYGFDISTAKDVSLDQCQTLCLSNGSCRAFTYNAKVNWCFLKSDFGRLQPSPGSIAGRVVGNGSEPDLGAPRELTFASGYTTLATNYRSNLIAALPANFADSVGALSAQGEAAARSGDPRTALAKFGLAAALAPEDSASWAGIARAAMAIDAQSNERRKLRETAAAAAFNAYQTSRTLSNRADALALMGRAFEAMTDGRPAIEAYKASLELADSAEIRDAYAAARSRYGFRMLEHTVDAEAATPRACVQFSEDLAAADFSSFVTLDGASPQSLVVNSREICIDGLDHGGRYRITLRAGLPSKIGEVLEKPVALNIFVPDRQPSLRFTGDNFVLPGTARRGIPIISVNTDKADIELYRVGDRGLARALAEERFLTQLRGYSLEQIRAEIGEPVWKGEIDIRNELNKEVTTSFPVDEAVPQRKPGVYVMTAKAAGDRSDYWDPKATQWFVVSDIGLTTFTGEDGLTVFARSLGGAQPIDGVALTLIARNNEVLGEVVTDAEGMARFEPGLTRGEAGLEPVALTAQGEGDDFVFLDLVEAGFDFSDRGVTGRPAAGALDVFAWTERGIYRAGETVHAQALTRDGAARAVADLPVVFIFTRPDGMEDRRIVSRGAEAGGHSVDLTLQSNAQRGAWTMRVYTDPDEEPLAEKNFLVEDFVPDRAEFTLTGGGMVIGQPTELQVDGRFLYGAPAAGLTLEGDLSVATTQSWSAFPGYVFGLTDEDVSEVERTEGLYDLPALDGDGKAVFEVGLDEAADTTRLLTGTVTVRMRENGGRPVERSLALDIAPTTEMIGIRPNFADFQVPEGGTAGFQVIAAGTDGRRIDMQGMKWSLVRVETHYQWYRDGTYWRYEPVEMTTKIASGTIDVTADDAGTISAPVDWGRYRLDVSSPDVAGPISSVEFHAGYYVEASSTDTPDGLEIALDKGKYAPGETAKLKISPRFAGEALITVGSERLLATFSASVPEGGTTVDIPVSADWGAGAYVTATLFRPGDAEKTRMPMRAIGVKWLGVDPGERALAVTLDAPERIEPNSTLTVPVSVAGLKAGEEAYVTLAAIDVGILNLTRHEPPAPEGWYFGQRRLGLEMRDLYGRLIDGSAGEMGKLRTGGDGMGLRPNGSPPTEKLLALYSGIVRLDADGKATVSFDVPQFNGTARLMAVAWSGEGVGHGTQDVIIRDPVVIMASTPRFMAVGDTTQMLVELANTDGPAGDYELSIAPSEELSASVQTMTVALASGARESVRLQLSAEEIGSGTVTVRLAHADGIALAATRYVPVRAETLPVTTRMEVPLAANGGAISIDRELLAASILDGASVSVGVSRDTAFDIPSLLMTLDRYPYGCAEQTTSRALPLLYVSQLARNAGLPDDPDLAKRIQGAIDRVLNYQSSSGSFGLWGPGGGDEWLDAYVTDFLTRAREQGYDVPEQAMMQALDNLQNTLAYSSDLASQGSEIAYALYVLARNRRASLTDLRYYSETQIDAFKSPMSRAQLGASLALYGDQTGAENAFSSALTLARATGPQSVWRTDYGSRLRDGAAMLALAAETQPSVSSVEEMIGYVSGIRKSTRWTSTQDEAWMLLAARALAADENGIDLDVNGTTHDGPFAERVEGSLLVTAPIRVTNRGDNPVDVTITTVAAPKQPLPAGGDGFAIQRRYYSLEGEEVSVTEVKQNERYVVVLTVNELNAWPSRILVTDLLPAGFEIDNPNIVGSAELTNFPWLGNVSYAHSEYRDDRFVAAFNRSGRGDREFSFAYVVRAVTPGNYAHPAASVEDMYRPGLSARTATGRMLVTAE